MCSGRVVALSIQAGFSERLVNAEVGVHHQNSRCSCRLALPVRYADCFWQLAVARLRAAILNHETDLV